MNDNYLQQAVESENKYAKGGWWTIIGVNIPTVLFAGIMFLAFQIRVMALPAFPPDQIDKSIFYGLSLGVWELTYCLLSGGYGLLSIPTAIIAFVGLVYFL
jgi:hypothetical protein